MNEEAIKKHLLFISNAIQEAQCIDSVYQGFWMPSILREKPHYENYWADGYEFTFYVGSADFVKPVYTPIF